MAEERKKAKEIDGFKIESGVELPQSRRRGRYIKLYDAMKKDESILYKDEEGMSGEKEATRMIMAFRNRSKKLKDDRKFESHKVPEGQRVWRI